MIEKINTGIVLKKWIYEDEHMVNILTEGGSVLRLKAKGLDSLVSKNAHSLQVFNKVEVEYFTSPTTKRNTGRLKTARAIKEYMGEHNDINFGYIEVIRNIISDQDHNSILTFNVLEEIIYRIENNTMNFQHIWALMIVTLRQNGYTTTVDRCVKCGSNQNIKGFEIYEGGLICKNHDEGESYKLDASTLVKIIEINTLKNPMDCKDLKLTMSEIAVIRSMYKQFFENQLAINLYMLDRKHHSLKE